MDPPASCLFSTAHLQKHPHPIILLLECVTVMYDTYCISADSLYSSHTLSHVNSHKAEQAHNEFEQLHTYSKVIYFISPIKGSDNIVARHCKSISPTLQFISARSTNGKDHPLRRLHGAFIYRI